jgi:hypothetical protein
LAAVLITAVQFSMVHDQSALALTIRRWPIDHQCQHLMLTEYHLLILEPWILLLSSSSQGNHQHRTTVI